MARPLKEILTDLAEMEHASRRLCEVHTDSAKRFFRGIFDEKFNRVAIDLALPQTIREVGEDDMQLLEFLRRHAVNPFETPPGTHPADGLW